MDTTGAAHLADAANVLRAPGVEVARVEMARVETRSVGRLVARAFVGLAVLGGCAWVFMAWHSPHLAVELATVVKACF